MLTFVSTRYESEDEYEEPPPPMPVIPTNIDDLQRNTNTQPSYNLNNQSSSSVISSSDSFKSPSIESSQSNFHVTPANSREIADRLKDTRADTSAKPTGTATPSLMLPSLTKQTDLTPVASRNNRDFSDDEDDAFRESTNSFFSALEQPSTEDLRGAYNKDNDLARNIERANESSHITRPPVHANNTFSIARPLVKPQTRVPVSSSQPSKPVYSPPFSVPVRHSPLPEEDDVLNKTISTKGNALATDKTTSKLTSANPKSDTTSSEFSNNLNNNAGGSRALSPELKVPELNTTIRPSKSMDLHETQPSSVDDLAKSIAEEFASPAFMQAIPPIPKVTTIHPSSSTTSLSDISAKNIGSRELVNDASQPQQPHQTETRGTEQLHDPLAESQATNSSISTAGTHKRDFSISSYLDDFYNDDEKDTLAETYHAEPLVSRQDTSTPSSASDHTTHSQADSHPAKKETTAATSIRNFSSSSVKSTSTVNTIMKPENEDSSDDSASLEEIGFSTKDKDLSSREDEDQPINKTPAPSSPNGAPDSTSKLTESLSSKSEQKSPPRYGTPPLSHIKFNGAILPDTITDDAPRLGDGFTPHSTLSPSSPLPMPSSRFHVPGGRLSTSDSMRSFAGNETDDTASLSTGRKSPQSFSYSNRDSYDFRGPNTGLDSGSSPSTSSGADAHHSSVIPENSAGAPTLDQIKKEIPGPTSPVRKVGRWIPLAYAESSESSRRSSVEAGFEETHTETNSADNSTFHDYKQTVNTEKERTISESSQFPALDTNNVGASSEDTKDTPVTAEQKDLERQIMDSFAGSTSSVVIPAISRTKTPEISRQQTASPASDASSSGKRLPAPLMPSNSYETAPQPFPSPMSPTVPDPIVAELYRDSSKLLSRPISQLIPTTQPLLPRSRSSFIENLIEEEPDAKFLEAPFVYNGQGEESNKKDRDSSPDVSEKPSTAFSAPPVPTLATTKSNELERVRSSSPSITSTSSDLSRSNSIAESSRQFNTHSRKESIGVKSLILDLSPSISPVQSIRTHASRVISGEGLTKRSSLIINDVATPSPQVPGRQKSLAELLNRPPAFDFQGILTRPRSVDRKAAFDLARQEQANYDSGLQTWLIQTSANRDMRALGKSSAPITQVQKSSTTVLGVSTSAAANKFKHFAAHSMQTRKLSSAFTEVSNKTHGLTDKLHISGISEKSSSALSRFGFGKKKPKP